MTNNRASRAVLYLLRAAAPSAFTFIGLTAVIVGILAMHVWMGGHGSTSHHVAPPTTTTQLSNGTGHVPADGRARTTPAPLTAVTVTGATVLDTALDIVSNMAHGSAVDGDVLTGCGGDCADEMMLGMCVLAMIIAGIVVLLSPTGRALLSSLSWRGPPALFWTSRPAPTPSLIELCISRT